MKNTKYTTVIWDMDGTLLNTIEDLTDGVNHVMRIYHWEEKSVAQVMSYVGNGVERLMELCVPDGKENAMFERAFYEFKAFYTKNCNEKTGAYDGVLQTMDALKQAGIKQAIVSNKNQSAVEALAQLYFGGKADVAIGQREGIPKKPQPDMVNLALAELKSTREEAVYVGDSEVDVQTAKNSQMDGIAVTWGFRSREHIMEHGATTLVDTPKELLELLLS